MKQVVTLERHEQSMLEDVLEDTINRQYKIFVENCDQYGYVLDNSSDYKCIDILMFSCPIRLKQSIFYKALYLKTQLRQARKNEE